MLVIRQNRLHLQEMNDVMQNDALRRLPKVFLFAFGTLDEQLVCFSHTIFIETLNCSSTGSWHQPYTGSEYFGVIQPPCNKNDITSGHFRAGTSDWFQNRLLKCPPGRLEEPPTLWLSHLMTEPPLPHSGLARGTPSATAGPEWSGPPRGTRHTPGALLRPRRQNHTTT